MLTGTLSLGIPITLLCVKLWAKLHAKTVTFEPRHLLWALYFLKCYPTQPQAASLLKCDEKTFLKWCDRAVDALAEMDVIHLEDRFIDWRSSELTMYVDGIDCRIREQVIVDSGDYSHKFNGPGMRYVIATATGTGRIVFVSTGYTNHDCTIAAMDLIKTLNEKILRRALSLFQSHHKNVNGCVKDFDILAAPF
ncbi:hypothetical protein DFJ73DRAFT_758102 [Zopfochytrium polystomum]|nr:hypothetical protein DFJ73DRAFT_758102 [Zopfochytrium polystomum]